MTTIERIARALACLFAKHDIYAIGRPTEWSMHAGCRHCRREWGYTTATPIPSALPWRAVSEFYAERGYRRPDHILSQGGEG